MNELCKLLAEKLGLAYDYVVANAPEILERYTDYKIALTSIGLCASALIFLLSIIGIIWITKTYFDKESNTIWEKYNYYDKNFTEFGVFIMLLTIIFFVIGIATLSLSIFNLLAWTKVPEIQIIKELGVLG